VRVQIKQMKDRKWGPIKVDDLIGMTVVEYIQSQEDKVIAAIYDKDVAVAFISNRDDLVLKYAKKGFSAHADDLLALLGEQEHVPLLAKTFKDTTLIELVAGE
jgi:hypothetical protein